MAADLSLFQPLLEDQEFQNLLGCLRSGTPASVGGLVESSKALVLHLLRALTGRQILLLVPDEARLDEYARDLAAFARLSGSESAAARIVRFPPLGADPYQGIPPHLSVSMERVTALAAAASGQWDFLIAPARTLTTPLPSPERFLAMRTRVRTGDRLQLDAFLVSAASGGYRHEEMVGGQGEFSRRGGIVDIFPPGAEYPLRIELDGEEVASIRTFDPDTQRSVARVDTVDILPVVEAPIGDDARERLAIAAALWRDRVSDGPDARSWRDRLTSLEDGAYVPGIEALIRTYQTGTTDLMAYTGGSVRVVDEPDRTGEELLSAVAEMEASRRASPGCPLPPAGEIFIDPAASMAQIKRADMRLSELRVAGDTSTVFASQPARNYGGRVLDFLKDIGVHRTAGRRILVFLSTRGTRERLSDILKDYEITYTVSGGESGTPVQAAPPQGRTGTGRGIVRAAPLLAEGDRASSAAPSPSEMDGASASSSLVSEKDGVPSRGGQSGAEKGGSSITGPAAGGRAVPAGMNQEDAGPSAGSHVPFGALSARVRQAPFDPEDEFEIDPDLVVTDFRPEGESDPAGESDPDDESDNLARPEHAGGSGASGQSGTPPGTAAFRRSGPSPRSGYGQSAPAQLPRGLSGAGSRAPGGDRDPAWSAASLSIPPGQPIVLIESHLNYGFVLPEIGLTVVTEREIFGEEARPATPKRRKGAAFISDFRDLKAGDMVVHVDHGVGRYLGLSRPAGSPRDFMLLQYAEDARLYVPVDRLDLVQKYGVGEGEGRSLDKLGGPGWERVKSRVQRAIRDMTKELLDLYATRKAIAGRAFSTDTPWQREFEDAFPFTLTVDQERAIGEVKADMESQKPMERLLCGDVGYGKTEVAMRAAFKAVQDGTQVAILAPTTVLALQHWHTFRERFKAFPVVIEMVSRLREPREHREVLGRLAQGKVDILIGTHRILSKDVVFRELGLLIVDEEQRFGVAHKERLKQMSTGIDTLAMSATPIPRTLQMSLAGVRDLSVIETPPMNRLAIQTNLVPYNRGTLAAAIRSELRRGGQIYFVHNRIQSIYRIAAKVQTLVPEARIAVTHGQMDVKGLEETMVRFLRGDFDILVSTTIIENGLDIPRVNTLIVNRADRMGLSQLYQLRGRVGRSDVRAYSYFIVPSRRTLTPIARRRLLALQEFSDLGAGFRIAALDLELRGAGDLLGARQHGHIAALGFDLYLKMLEEAVREYQGAPPAPEAATFNLGVDIRLSDSYVPEPNLRLALYKRISSAAGTEELAEIRAEMEDRYGKLPESGANLFSLAELRVEAGRLGVKSVEFGEGKLSFRFHEKPVVTPDRVIAFLKKQATASLSPTGILRIPAPLAAPARIEAARIVLRALAS